MTKNEEFMRKLRPILQSHQIAENVAADCPHIDIPGTDLYCAAMFRAADDSVTIVTNDMAAELHIAGSDIVSAAMRNGQAEPYTIAKVSDFLGLEADDGITDVPLYVMTTQSAMYGAPVILDPDAREAAAKALGGDYFVLPSSVHEVLLMPDNGTVSANDLRGLVREVNATAVRPQDRLSGEVYRYDMHDKRIRTAGNAETETVEPAKTASHGRRM